MSGQWIDKIHTCEPPVEPANLTGIGNGSLWQCECEQIWKLTRHGSAIYWAEFPPKAFIIENLDVDVDLYPYPKWLRKWI